jgi:toxin ParE1/3/4
VTNWRLHPKARIDLNLIWDYSEKEWGIDQAETYTRSIQSAIEAIATDPARGQKCDHIRAGYWRIRSGSHLIFFQRESTGVVVVRILHERMDVSTQLNP